MWQQIKRIVKFNSAIILFAGQPFTSALIMTNLKMFKYSWVWEKSKSINFAQAKNMPLKFTEDIPVFSKAPIGHVCQLGERRMTYNPQGLIEVNKEWKRPRKYENGHQFTRKSHKLERIIEYANYPCNILKFSNSGGSDRGLHPTQKPVALMEYLIKTYTNEGETILDFTMGSGTTMVAAKKLNRKAIGIELSKEYCYIAIKRLEEIK